MRSGLGRPFFRSLFGPPGYIEVHIFFRYFARYDPRYFGEVGFEAWEAFRPRFVSLRFYEILFSSPVDTAKGVKTGTGGGL